MPTVRQRDVPPEVWAKLTAAAGGAAGPVPSGGAVRAEVPLPPSVNNLFVTRGRRRVKSPEYRAWLARVGPVLSGLRPPAAFPVALVVRVRGELNVQRDLDNLLKPIGDALVAAGALPADDVRRVARWEVSYEGGEGEAVAVVELRPFDSSLEGT